jgi:tRNA dimethylallyltransferase
VKPRSWSATGALDALAPLADLQYRRGMGTVFLVGPTAVGKSAVALDLAMSLKVEIVSADSMQVYRGMDVGTAKAKDEERRAVPHHLIDVCDVEEPFDVKRFVDLASSAISDIISRGKTPLIVGGTGLYVRALRRGLFEGPSRNPKLRERLEKMTAVELFDELQRIDPRTAKTIDRHNPRRLVRALEVFHQTGKPISELQKEWSSVAQASSLRGAVTSEGKLEACPTVFLHRQREDLYERIERRIDKQIAAGWVKEVEHLLKSGLEKNATAMQAAGYRELVAHLRGDLSLDKAIALIKTRTRQLARRQLTWFRREPQLNWIEIGRDESPADTARRIYLILREKENHSAS